MKNKNIKDKNQKIDIEHFWDKKEKSFNWSKYFLIFIYVGFALILGVFCVDTYMKNHDLVFIKIKVIDPEFGFVINGKDKVVYYLPLNDDARDIYSLDMFKGKSRSDALEKAIEVAKENNYLSEWDDKVVSITVVSDEKNKALDIEQKVVEDLKDTDSEIKSNIVEATKEDVEKFGKLELSDLEDDSSAGDEPNCNYTKLVTKNMSGDNRTLTSYNVSRELYANGFDKAIIVNAQDLDLIDGYLASSLSYSYNAPIFYIDYKNDADTITEIRKNFDTNGIIYLLGGESKIPEDNALFNGLKAFGFNTVRIFGADRYETSINVAKEMDKIKQIDSIFLVPSTDDMIDAGLVSSISGRHNIPMIYSDNNELVPSVKEYIKSNKNIKKIYLVSTLFSDNVVSSVEELGFDVEIIGGSDRFDTNAKLLDKFVKRFESAVLVNNQVDLIVASSFAAKKNAALFYVTEEISDEQVKVIKNNKNIKTLYYFGGESIVVPFREMTFEIKKANVSKCSNSTKELLFMNKHAIFYIPHQYDETVYFGQVITAAVEQLGAENVHVIEFTDGSATAVKNDSEVKNLLKEQNLTIKEARDKEFEAACRELGVTDYKFVEDIDLANDNDEVKERIPDNKKDGYGISAIYTSARILPYRLEQLYHTDGGVTHFTFTNMDSHIDHNSLGKMLETYYFSYHMLEESNTEFSDVYLIVTNTDYENGLKSKIPSKYFLSFKNPTSYPLILKASEKYKQDLSNGLLGIGYRSGTNVFDDLTQKIQDNNLTTQIHVPFK